jgi:hypothetical protein
VYTLDFVSHGAGDEEWFDAISAHWFSASRATEVDQEQGRGAALRIQGDRGRPRDDVAENGAPDFDEDEDEDFEEPVEEGGRGLKRSPPPPQS